MSKKTRTPQSPEEKKAYWLKRLVEKANRVFPQLRREIDELVQMAEHAGVGDQEKAGIRNAIIESTLQATNKLAPPAPQYDPTKAGKEPNVSAPNH